MASTTFLGHDWHGTPTAVDVVDGTISAVRVIATAPRITLLPGLHDHHVHLRSASARRVSLDVSACRTRDEFVSAIRTAAPSDALRVIGYDDTRVGPLDRHDLDAITHDVPVRVQHRGGHLWVLNSPACARVRADIDPPADGRFWDRDGDLAASSAPVPPEALREVVRTLTSRGVVAVDDMTPTLTAVGALQLRADVGADLAVQVFGADGGDGVKIVLGDHQDTDLGALAARIAAARPHPVAVHCVTAEALVTLFAVEPRLRAGDRIEHAFVTPADFPALFRAPDGSPAVGVHPGFLRTHGDRHATHGSTHDVADYLRVRSWAAAGLTLYGGTDLPFSARDPWQAMQAAVDRRTAAGRVLSPDEAITPEEAFTLFHRDGWDGRGARLDLRVGDPADICAIDRSWRRVRADLGAVDVVATVRGGRVTFGGL